MTTCNASPDLVSNLPHGPPKTYHNHNHGTAKIKISIKKYFITLIFWNRLIVLDVLNIKGLIVSDILNINNCNMDYLNIKN